MHHAQVVRRLIGPFWLRQQVPANFANVQCNLSINRKKSYVFNDICLSTYSTLILPAVVPELGGGKLIRQGDCTAAQQTPPQADHTGEAVVERQWDVDVVRHVDAEGVRLREEAHDVAYVVCGRRLHGATGGARGEDVGDLKTK